MTIVPRVWIQEETPAIATNTKRTDLFRGTVGNRRATGATVEPENKRQWLSGLQACISLMNIKPYIIVFCKTYIYINTYHSFSVDSLDEPVKECTAGNFIDGDITGVMREA